MNDIYARAMAKKALEGGGILDENNKIPISMLPGSLIGAVTYMGSWDASTNTPTIPTAAIGNKGNYYVVSAYGTTTVNSESVWDVGNWIISDGTKWSKIATIQKVSSVSNKTGNVTIDKYDVGLSNVQNVDTTDANNISSGTIGHDRLPIATAFGDVGVIGIGSGLNIDVLGKISPKIGTGIKTDETGTIQVDYENIDVTKLKNASLLSLGSFKNTFDNTTTTLDMFADADKSDFWLYNGINDYSLGGHTWEIGDQLWCNTPVVGVPVNLTTNFSVVPNTIGEATTTVSGTAKLSSVVPLVDNLTPSIGTSNALARQDHVHPAIIMGASGVNHKFGYVPDTPVVAGSTKYLCEDGSWKPPIGQLQEWTSYTPTITGSTTNPTLPTTKTLLARYKVVGKSLHLSFTYFASIGAGAGGTAGVGTYMISLPNGYNIDTTLAPLVGTLASAVNNRNGATASTLGLGVISTVTVSTGVVVGTSANTVGLYLTEGNTGLAIYTTWGSVAYGLHANNTHARFTCEIPIL